MMADETRSASTSAARICGQRSRPRSMPMASVPKAPTPDFGPSFGERISNFGDALTGCAYTNFEDQGRTRNATYQALLNIAAEHGGLSADAAADYFEQLRESKRYQKDVY